MTTGDWPDGLCCNTHTHTHTQYDVRLLQHYCRAINWPIESPPPPSSAQSLDVASKNVNILKTLIIRRRLRNKRQIDVDTTTIRYGRRKKSHGLFFFQQKTYKNILYLLTYLLKRLDESGKKKRKQTRTKKHERMATRDRHTGPARFIHNIRGALRYHRGGIVTAVVVLFFFLFFLFSLISPRALGHKESGASGLRTRVVQPTTTNRSFPLPAALLPPPETEPRSKHCGR